MNPQNQLLILMYHGIVREPLEIEDQCFLAESAFRNQMLVLKENFQILPLSEAVRRLRNHAISQPTVALTFDDGFQNNYEIAFPILRNLDIPATIFPVTGPVGTSASLWNCRINKTISETKEDSLEWCGERFDLSQGAEKVKSSWLIQNRLKEFPHPEFLDQLRILISKLGGDPDCEFKPDSPFRILDKNSISEMAASGLIEFGAHTHSHAILSLLSSAESEAEIKRSIASVEELTGKPCNFFAYPNGGVEDYNDMIIKILEESGIQAAVTTLTGMNDEITPLMELRRYGVSPNLSPDDFKKKIIQNSRNQVPVLLTQLIPRMRSTVPELTVSIPAYNTGKYIKQAIQSVLQQEAVNFELIVIDDGSEDDTVDIVQSFQDPRIRLIRNKRNMGIGFCHNLGLKKSRAPFIAHVDSDDIVLPGAFRKLLDKIKSSQRTGQVHCYYFRIAEDGAVTREDFCDQRRDLIKNRPPTMDYKRELLIQGAVSNGLRTYRKMAIEAVGGFNENIKYGIDYDMALRIIDKFEIQLIPEFLYCSRTHPRNASKVLLFQGLRFWWQRLNFSRKLLKNDLIHFPQEREYRLGKLLTVSLWHALKLASIKSFARRIVRYLDAAFQWVSTSVVDFFSRVMLKCFPRWPIMWFKFQKRNEVSEGKRIAYYLWHFPTLSQTFIRREVKALKNAGLSIQVVADAPGDMKYDERVARIFGKLNFIDPIDKKRLLNYKRDFLRKNPLAYLNLFLYVVCHRYGKYKSFNQDRVVFEKAVYLAGILKENNINHVHAPWADRCAFTAMIASRLLGVPYTVQGRAHDIHRIKHRFGRREIFENAQFVITNSFYNKSCIESLVPKRISTKIYSIYEGIDLQKFNPGFRNGQVLKEAKILSVARLIEEKGLVYLLKACKILKESGHKFQCNIVGGNEIPLYMNYYIELMRLHKKLELEDCVFFSGVLSFEEIIEEYRWAEIFALPCVIAGNGGRDISPNSLIEAMAMELPVISTNISAIPEIVDHGVNGLLVTPNDEQSLADSIKKLISNPSLRNHLGENARKKIEGNFDIKKNIRKYLKIFGQEGFKKLPKFEVQKSTQNDLIVEEV